MSQPSSSPRSDLPYWVATALFCLGMTFSGLAGVFRIEAMREEIMGLGYPVYLLTILGVAKLAGVAVIAAPGWPRLKEWAYAGFVIDLTGALASHLFVSDPVEALVGPLAMLALAFASYGKRPASRRLAG